MCIEVNTLKYQNNTNQPNVQNRLFTEKMVAGPFQGGIAARSRLATAAEITFKSTELAALFDLGAVQAWRSGMALHLMRMACLCWWRETSVCVQFAHVCTCLA